MTSKTENADGVLFALADPIAARLTAAQRQGRPAEAWRRRPDAVTLLLSQPRRFGATSFARALRGQLVPQNPVGCRKSSRVERARQDVENDQFFRCHVPADVALLFLGQSAAQFQQLLKQFLAFLQETQAQ